MIVNLRGFAAAHRGMALPFRLAFHQPLREAGVLCANSVILCVSVVELLKEDAHHRDTEIAQRTTETNHGPNRWRYSVEVMNAFTISAATKLPLKLFSLVS